MPLFDRLPSLQRLRADPPHRAVQRMLRTGRRTGLLGMVAQRPAALLRIALAEGLGIRSIHRLHAAVDPGRPALVDRYRTIDYRTADAEIDAAAAALQRELGARRGVPVALMMDNRTEYVLAWFALMRLGITAAHLSRYGRPDEIEPLLRRSGAKIVIVSPETLPVIEHILAGADPPRVRVVVAGGTTPIAGPGTRVDTWSDLVARHAHATFEPPRRQESSDNVVYTSGTTGRPKGAIRDLRSVGAMELLRILDRLPLAVGDRHLVVAPLYHSGAQAFALINTSLGATIRLEDKFDAQRTLRTLCEARINNVFLVPTMIRRILDLPEAVHEAWSPRDLRAIVSGAAMFSDPLRQRASARFGPRRIFDFYGATELGWVTLVDGEEMTARPGTVGRAIPGQEIRIADGEGRPLAAGEVGKVFTRSAQLMVGYDRDRKATDETRDGEWSTVDDLGYLDDAGYLFLTGRARDMVISGGMNLYPVEIENALAHHPAIEEVAVIGLPDEQWGERLVAVVVPAPGFDPEQAAQWARDRLSSYKIPRQWVTVDALPRNPTGKVLKQQLRETLAPD
jgi:fatty-acyl-CoA synthase